MRPRAVGGLEPDDEEQRVLVHLWHLSRTGLSHKNPLTWSDRVDWVVEMFLSEHPTVARKWVYNWCVDNLGHFTRRL